MQINFTDFIDVNSFIHNKTTKQIFYHSVTFFAFFSIYLKKKVTLKTNKTTKNNKNCLR